MNTNQLLIAMLLFIAFLLSGCSPKAAPDSEVVVDGAQAKELIGLKDCEFQPQGSKAGYAAECVTLTVPDN